MHNTVFILENETQILWYFVIQTDHLISAWQPGRDSLQKKRTCWIVHFAVPADHRVKLKEREKRDKYLNFARELKKLWNMWVTLTPIVIGALGTITKGLVQRRWDLEIRGDHPNYSIFKICQNIEKSAGDLRWLAVTQTPGKNHQLTMTWKTLKRVK